MYTPKYFVEREFQKCTPSCSLKDMDEGFLRLLDEVREKAQIPLVLNCAYRSVAWDKKKGRSGNSAHTRGKAVDIRCTTSANKMKIIKAALECGITRIGDGNGFVHLDNDTSLPQNVFFDYYND